MKNYFYHTKFNGNTLCHTYSMTNISSFVSNARKNEIGTERERERDRE